MLYNYVIYPSPDLDADLCIILRKVSRSSDTSCTSSELQFNHLVMVLTSSPVGADIVWKNLHVKRICLAAKHAWK